MASLVDYDDSDSDPDPEDEAVCPTARSDDEVEQSQIREESFALILNRQNPDPDNAVLKTMQYTDMITSEPSRHLASAHCAQRETVEKRTVPAPSSRQVLQSSVDFNTVKRPQPPPADVRPYIPKRQRLATPGEEVTLAKATEEGATPKQVTGLRLLTEVSERVRPFLGRRGGRGELPRCIQLHIQAHQGPVNTVQWCPVPHLSHLLLSASMDKTVKVWDGAESGRCLQTYLAHSGAVRDACWSPCGRRLLSGSFDNTARLTDVETGQEVAKFGNQFKVTCLALQPSNPDVFLCGGFSPEVKAWDSRSCKVVKVYKAGIQQTLDALFLSGGKEFVTSSDSVSRDSAERTLIAWDFDTTARVSNQIFHERYTCPTLALHPVEDSFVAQTNGNYIALFSAQRPYRMNKRRRYEGHKVEGYAVQCEFSQDGTVLASGSSTGSVHFYDHQSSRTLHTFRAHQQACVCVSLHPVLPAVAATCDWGGEIKIWH